MTSERRGKLLDRRQTPNEASIPISQRAQRAHQMNEIHQMKQEIHGGQVIGAGSDPLKSDRLDAAARYCVIFVCVFGFL